MSTGMIGIVASVFVALCAKRLGHEVAPAKRDLLFAMTLFGASMILPALGAIDGEVGFVIAGSILAAAGAVLLSKAAISMAVPRDTTRAQRGRDHGRRVAATGFGSTGAPERCSPERDDPANA